MKTKQKTTDRTVPKSKRTNRGGWGVETVCLGDLSKIDIPSTK